MATEMSERTGLAGQIAEHVEAKEYREAAAAVARAWDEASTFGVRHCPLPGYTDVWVKFKTSGYPFSLRRKWDEAKTDTATLGLILPYVVEWNLTDVDGQPVFLPAAGERSIETVANIEDALLMWLIREFSVFWFTELLTPKKLLVAIGKAAIDGEGDQPWLITQADLSRRTGWTFTELDEQDASQVMPALIGQSVRDALKRVDAYVQSQGKMRPDEDDLALYGDIIKLMAEE